MEWKEICSRFIYHQKCNAGASIVNAIRETLTLTITHTLKLHYMCSKYLYIRVLLLQLHAIHRASQAINSLLSPNCYPHFRDIPCSARWKTLRDSQNRATTYDLRRNHLLGINVSRYIEIVFENVLSGSKNPQVHSNS